MLREVTIFKVTYAGDTVLKPGFESRLSSLELMFLISAASRKERRRLCYPGREKEKELSRQRKHLLRRPQGGKDVAHVRNREVVW